MGRPINKKFFGNLNRPYDNQQTGGNSGVGGEGVSGIAVSNSGTLYSQGTTLSIGAPNIKGGIPATISYSINTAGNITVAVVEPGTGYTSAPTLTVTKAPTVTSTTNSGVTGTNTFTVSSTVGIAIGMLIAGAATGSSGYVQAINGNVITTTVPNNDNWTNASNLGFSDAGTGFARTVSIASAVTTQNAIAFTSFLTTGSNAVALGDILKQESSTRYLVQNSEGKGQCKLAATDALVAGQMKIIATDHGGSTYFVTKLTAHKAVLANRTGTSTALISIAAGGRGVGGWTLGAATGTVVTIASV
jgi:hypothetical protein